MGVITKVKGSAAAGEGCLSTRGQVPVLMEWLRDRLPSWEWTKPDLVVLGAKWAEAVWLTIRSASRPSGVANLVEG